MKRKVLAVLIAAVAALSLSACAQPSDQQYANEAAEALALKVVPASIDDNADEAAKQAAVDEGVRIVERVEAQTDCKVVSLAGGPMDPDVNVEEQVRSAAAAVLKENPDFVIGMYFGAPGETGAYITLDCAPEASATAGA